VQGPSTNSNVLKKIQKDNWESIVMFAGGSGVAPMLQTINYYLKSFQPLFLVWVLKSPKHNYVEEIDLDELSKRSKGRLKWIIIYSSSKAPSKQRRGGAKNISIDSTSDNTKETAMKNVKNFASNLAAKLSHKQKVEDLIALSRSQGSSGGSKGSKADDKSLSFYMNSSNLNLCNSFWSQAGQCTYHEFDHELISEVIAASKPDKNHRLNFIWENDIFFDSVDKVYTLDEDKSEKDDSKEKILKENANKNTLLAVSGSPRFNEMVQGSLRKLGFEENQIILF